MIDVHAGVNDGDDAGTCDVKAELRIDETNDLGGRLGCIAVHDDSPVVVHRSGVIQSGGDGVDGPLRKREEMVGFNALNTEQLLEETSRRSRGDSGSDCLTKSPGRSGRRCHPMILGLGNLPRGRASGRSPGLRSCERYSGSGRTPRAQRIREARRKSTKMLR